ncbi:hypothetical protein NHX12_032226 [Muraenolepis orangiensis]|uniref:Uncharacterized protein n=1 Tax=Muraenolepis orangiensis TaxID=630683 RepID=A0A9Q0E7E1_9TELE|nr:hypothetical protein NHX12_032226 [Muraenolepis orangiensis]
MRPRNVILTGLADYVKDELVPFDLATSLDGLIELASRRQKALQLVSVACRLKKRTFCVSFRKPINTLHTPPLTGVRRTTITDGPPHQDTDATEQQTTMTTAFTFTFTFTFLSPQVGHHLDSLWGLLCSAVQQRVSRPTEEPAGTPASPPLGWAEV